MRTIIVAAVIAVLAGIIYQKVVEENVSVKELAGYVAGTASEMINEASKAASEKDLQGIEESINSVTENAGSLLQTARDNFIKEKLPEIANIDMTEVWKNITCEKALSIYESYISGDMAGSNNEEDIYTVLSVMKQQGKSDSDIKAAIETLFCSNN